MYLNSKDVLLISKHENYSIRWTRGCLVHKLYWSLNHRGWSRLEDTVFDSDPRRVSMFLAFTVWIFINESWNWYEITLNVKRNNRKYSPHPWPWDTQPGVLSSLIKEKISENSRACHANKKSLDNWNWKRVSWLHNCSCKIVKILNFKSYPYKAHTKYKKFLFWYIHTIWSLLHAMEILLVWSMGEKWSTYKSDINDKLFKALFSMLSRPQIN